VDRTPDRSTPDWPVGLGAVLTELTHRDEVLLDLGPHGRLVVRRQADGGAGWAAAAALDPRAREALHLAGTGLPAVGIAAALGTDLADVARRLSSVRAALGVSSTAAAVALTRGADGRASARDAPARDASTRVASTLDTSTGDGSPHDGATADLREAPVRHAGVPARERRGPAQR